MRITGRPHSSWFFEIAARIMAHGIENPRSEEGIAMLMTMARM